MGLALICAGIALWALSMAIKFYRRADWNEAPESSPDFGEMHKWEAKLMNILDLLEEVHEQGKLSAGFMEEYQRFADREIAAIRAAEKAWKNRKTQKAPSSSA